MRQRKKYMMQLRFEKETRSVTGQHVEPLYKSMLSESYRIRIYSDGASMGALQYGPLPMHYFNERRETEYFQ